MVINKLKLKILIVSILVAIVLLLGVGYFWTKTTKKTKVYVLYNSNKDERINWSQFQNLFPPAFDPNNTLADIGELLKLDENQVKIYDSILARYYSQPHLLKVNNGNDFYLTINPNEAVLLKKKEKVKQISSEEISEYTLISLDSLIKIIPGMEYLQSKNSEKVKFLENPRFYIIEPLPGSKLLDIFRVDPVVEHYD